MLVMILPVDLVTRVLPLTLGRTMLLVLIVLEPFLICISAGILAFWKTLFNNKSVLEIAGCLGP